MAIANTARFIAAAALTAALTAPQALAAESMGKLIIVDKVLKGDTSGGGKAGKTGKQTKAGGTSGKGGQTARRPAPRGGGEGEFGVERPAPEEPDPYEVKGAGEGQGKGGDDGPPPGAE